MEEDGSKRTSKIGFGCFMGEGSKRSMGKGLGCPCVPRMGGKGLGWFRKGQNEP